MGRQRNLLHPELQKLADEFEKQCKKARLNVLITETFRTTAEQNALYAKGRTTSGKIVTNAKGSAYQSPHQWGAAFDFCENARGKEYASTTFFKKCGKIGKSLGLFWGGDFKSFVDMPHLELPKFLPNNSTRTLINKHGTPEKFIATWTGTHGHKKTTATPKPATPTNPTLRQGARGASVKTLQERLNKHGAKVATDGSFGARTMQAVKAFQKSKKLKSDGVVGGATWAALMA
jgi:peptidoglycan L-alanyl-D-glutamate endopeptidase CwlK